MRILLVEDDVFFRHFYAFKLKEKKFDVDEAGDGEEGLMHMQRVHPDLVLLDLIMPKKDGFSVLASKAADPNLKGIPVIVFSTLGQEEDMKKAMQLGAIDYINKSFFDFDGLLAKITSHLPK